MTKNIWYLRFLMIPRQRYTSEVVDFLPLYFLDIIRERYRCQGSKLLTQSMPQTCRPIIDRLKGLKPDTNPSFLQLSTAFLQLFHSFSIKPVSNPSPTFQGDPYKTEQLSHSFSTAYSQHAATNRQHACKLLTTCMQITHNMYANYSQHGFILSKPKITRALSTLST